jgi:3-isopropylmalate/(R)-2-methylmalate dehydratase small subunit
MNDLNGKVWKFGNDVDTDVIVPGLYLDAPMAEILHHVLESVIPDFAARVEAGDMIVAGTNFGCGSSREQAPMALKEAGLGCVVAESFSRIFFRNAIAIGLPVLTCRGVSDAFQEGQSARVSMKLFQIQNLETGRVLQGDPLSEEMRVILEKGGIIEFLKSLNL